MSTVGRSYNFSREGYGYEYHSSMRFARPIRDPPAPGHLVVDPSVEPMMLSVATKVGIVTRSWRGSIRKGVSGRSRQQCRQQHQQQHHQQHHHRGATSLRLSRYSMHPRGSQNTRPGQQGNQAPQAAGQSSSRLAAACELQAGQQSRQPPYGSVGAHCSMPVGGWVRG